MPPTVFMARLLAIFIFRAVASLTKIELSVCWLYSWADCVTAAAPGTLAAIPLQHPCYPRESKRTCWSGSWRKKNPSNEMAEQQEKCQTTWFLCECDCQYVANIIGIGIGIGWSLATCSFFFALLEGWNISCPCGCSCSRVAVVYHGWRMKWS